MQASNREGCNRKAFWCKNTSGCTAGLTPALVCVAAAGLLVVTQWEASVTGHQWWYNIHTSIISEIHVQPDTAQNYKFFIAHLYLMISSDWQWREAGQYSTTTSDVNSLYTIIQHTSVTRVYKNIHYVRDRPQFGFGCGFGAETDLKWVSVRFRLRFQHPFAELYIAFPF